MPIAPLIDVLAAITAEEAVLLAGAAAANAAASGILRRDVKGLLGPDLLFIRYTVQRHRRSS